MKLANSPVTQHVFDGIPFFLKRDDQLHGHFSGNKARKLMSLLAYDNPKITHLIGYGSPQANSLLSLAALASIKGWQLEFYVDRIPSWLKESPIGNYRGALDLGAKVIAMADICAESTHPADFIHKHRQDENHLLVPEGGRSPIAEEGVKTLADEILTWSRFHQEKPLAVALPAGTGTTALYLHKHLHPHGIEVLTCPCVGGESYLVSQFEELGETRHPTILTREQKHHFGKLYEQDYRVWQSLLEQTHIEFDLLYDPMMWRCLQTWYPQNADKQLLYIHQGGILGNESMLPRYERKYDLR
ncbi:pyridoxal-phosphate dependent enzyme [Enterovibrio norvegicus]|uniref:pyridoxal-phosphate dependent enzyme n=1 Tax=Enterovibrio norvegicus TaxID=188144 RepID=UPI000C81D885|nr:pyridoxal-phosphate dependent enzyme [Enterovibrio norvegicus]PMN73710.1 1-aminocyclopropane-1-carboxylate deaminase [Enterovibrio norvegicus]